MTGVLLTDDQRNLTDRQWDTLQALFLFGPLPIAPTHDTEHADPEWVSGRVVSCLERKGLVARLHWQPEAKLTDAGKALFERKPPCQT